MLSASTLVRSNFQKHGSVQQRVSCRFSSKKGFTWHVRSPSTLLLVRERGFPLGLFASFDTVLFGNVVDHRFAAGFGVLPTSSFLHCLRVVEPLLHLCQKKSDNRQFSRGTVTAETFGFVARVPQPFVARFFFF